MTAATFYVAVDPEDLADVIDVPTRILTTGTPFLVDPDTDAVVQVTVEVWTDRLGEIPTGEEDTSAVAAYWDLQSLSEAFDDDSEIGVRIQSALQAFAPYILEGDAS